MRKLPARKLLGAIIASALLIPYKGFSLGLGEIEVNSALNQKLNAEIELLSAAPEDAETLIVKLASRKEFSRAGIDRPYLLNDLRFKSEIIDGVPHIKVYSASPVREPFLNFLIEVDWPNGHLLREYTVLLDPPVFMTQQHTAAPQVAAPNNNGFRPSASGTGGSTNIVPVVAPGISASPRPQATSQAPAVAPAATPTVSQPAQNTWVPAPVVQQQTDINQPPGTYKIKAGDTAWSLANAMRPDQNITVPQMLVALLRNNPESFINENMNGLKRGYILRVPEYNDIASVNPAEAAALMREQAALWREYQASQSGGQPVSAMPAESMKTADGSGSAAADAGDDAYLEIVSAGSGTSTSGKDPTQMTAAELRAELSLARERVETEQVEKEALQQRISTLEQRVDKMKGMLSIEDAEMADVQSLNLPEGIDAEGVQAEEEMSAESAVEAMKAGLDEGLSETEQAEDPLAKAEMSAEGLAGEEMAGEEATDPASEEEGAVFVDEMESDGSMAQNEAGEELAEEPVEDSTMQQAVAPAPQIVNRPPPADPLTQLLNNPMMLAAAGGGLLLIAALIGLIIKRRKSAGEAESSDDVVSSSNDLDDLESLADDIAEESSQHDDMPESLAGDETDGDEAFDSESTMILDAADETVITEAEPEADIEDEPRDDVIAEADVYLAYGIYQQAEELLTQAITDNPDRDDYRLKLAETHYASKNADAFTGIAEEIKQRVNDDSSPIWKKVVGMGQDLCADNPMFQGSMVGTPDVAALASDAPEMDFDLGLDEDNGDAGDLDLSLDDEPLELPDMETDDAVESAEPMDELEFDLSDAGAVEEAAAEEDEFSLDIDASELDIDIKDEAEDAVADDSAEASLDLTDVDLDLGDAPEESADVVEDIGDVDIDFGLDDTETDAAVDSAESDEEISLDLTEEAEALDMDLGEETVIIDAVDTSEAVAEAEESTEAAPAPSADDEEDFDLSNLDDVDEVSTKLDLARAYLDMGDHDGSRGILEEVIAEGTDEQKQEANDLLSKLD